MLDRVNVASSKNAYLDGLLLDPESQDLERVLGSVLGADKLEFGVIVTHHKYSGEDWARAVAFLWFRSDRPRR